MLLGGAPLLAALPATRSPLAFTPLPASPMAPRSVAVPGITKPVATPEGLSELPPVPVVEPALVVPLPWMMSTRGPVVLFVGPGPEARAPVALLSVVPVALLVVVPVALLNVVPVALFVVPVALLVVPVALLLAVTFGLGSVSLGGVKPVELPEVPDVVGVVAVVQLLPPVPEQPPLD